MKPESSIYKEKPSCYPSSHGTRACNPVIMVSFPGGLRGSCQPSSWFCFESLIQTAWRAFTELRGAGQLLTNNIPLPHPQSPWEEWLERLHPWVVAKCSMHTSFLHPASLSQPLNLLWTQDVLFPLWAQWLMATNSSKQWWTLVPPRRPIVSMWSPLSAWCQGSEFRISASQLLNKRKISCDDFHNKAVSINWDSCCSGTEVSPHGKGHHLKRVLIAQGTDSSGYW